MLYGALTGQVPFTGTVAEVVTQHREVVAEPPSALDPSLAPLDDLLGRMLAKRPTERFADGAATLDAFREARRALHEAPGVVPHRAGRMPA
jgi:eukaryotic-like serine/threonine-protein kinase